MNILKWLFKPSPNILGRRGEDAVASKLSWAGIFGREGLTLQNVYVPTGNGKTVEIDLLYITVKGIFVIESKNYSGYIFGNEMNREWTTTLYAGKSFLGFKQVEKHHFYNPIWQNKTHMNCLRRYLSEEIPMWSLIVFSDRCEFKDVSYQAENTIVCHKRDLGYEIKTIWNRVPDALTEEEVKNVHSKLCSRISVDEATKTEHVAQIRTGQHSTYKCPLCGGKLVLRTAKKGPYAGNKFYGCSNYPECRYTRNL